MRSYVQRHVAAAAEAIGPDAHASVTFLHAGATLWLASSSDSSRRCDLVETQLDDGPCIDAMRGIRPVLVPDIDRSTTWPRWRDRALAEGFHWCAATPADLGSGSALALNVYSSAPLGLGAIGTASDRAGALAVEMRRRLARDESDLNLADSSDTAAIDQAIGVVMQAKDCGADQARGVLQKVAAGIGWDLPVAARRLLDLTVAGVDPLDEQPDIA